VVVRRQAVVGEAVEPQTELYAVADLSTMWVCLDVYEKDVSNVRVGQAVTFEARQLPSGDFSGAVSWISPEVDARTRTIRVRAEVANPAGLLRANLYGTGSIQIGEVHEMLMVPRVAVQSHEDHPVVFVRKSETEYEPRRVALGHEELGFCEITAGVKEGELVVTTGSFLFKTELNRGAIAAGCCDD
jgi:cobalt-zinc-cadmium efflux system membrane fusion protein